jgi:hypothetical protein
MSEASTTLTHDARPSVFKALFRLSLASHGIFFALALFYLFALVLSYAFYSPASGGSTLEVLAGIATSAVPFALFAIVLRELFSMVRSERPVNPTKRLVQRVGAVLKDPLRMGPGLPMFLAFALFMFVFTTFKGHITVMVPFSWDPALDRWDRALHFGMRPWELMRPVLDSGFAIFLINVNYNFWFIVMNLFLVHFAFYVPPGEERTHFFLIFFALWMVGGTLLATYFSSAGPCYFDKLGLGGEAYGPLMSRLGQINETWPIWALGTQDTLWYFKQQGSALGGVSAMPSLHNATALLFIFVVWGKGRVFPWLVTVHGVLIFFGSILLGWHYAVDAYLSFALTIVCWFALKPVARWWHTRPSVSSFDNAFSMRKAA